MALPLPSQALNVNPKRSNINQPVYVKLINRIGEKIRTAGYNKPDLNADLLIKQAKKKRDCKTLATRHSEMDWTYSRLS